MENELDDLVRVNKDNLKPGAITLARAFYEYPLVQFFIPDAARRLKKQSKAFEGALRYGIRHGEVYATSWKLEGVAIWFLAGGGKKEPEERKTIGQRLGDLFADKAQARRVRAFSDYTKAVRTRLMPGRHWYLEILGVTPEYQGKGFSSRLVKPMLARADKEGLPCFLETQLEKNVSLYKHLGFRVAEEGVIPCSSVTSWSMVRDVKK
jgi:GNAT superfamily N-acetyltransferase